MSSQRPHCCTLLIKAPRRETCKNCQSSKHLYRQCPENVCHECNFLGHISVDCPLAPLKYQNKTYQCGCNPNEIEAQRQYYYSNRRTHHCCYCKNPQRPETLQELDQV